MAKTTSRTDRPARTSILARRRRGAAGYTLVEAMIASALLSVSVLGVSGTILSSYAHDLQSQRQHDGLRAAESLKDELTAIPMEPATTSDVGLTDFASYSDVVSADQLMVAVASKASQKQTAAGTTNTSTATSSNTGLLGSVVGIVGGLLGGGSGTSSGGGTSGSGGSTSSSTITATSPASGTASMRSSRTVQVERRATLAGSSVPTGELAIVTIDVTVGPSQTVRLKRLISSTEAAANAGAGSVP